MNNKTQEALKMAIEAIEYTNWSERTAKMETALEACKEALEQPAQEPVAWATEWEDGEWSVSHSPNMGKQSIPLYTHHAPSWQGLSNDMVRAIGEKCQEENRGILNWIDFYNAIESMLKDKNYE